MFKGGDIVCMFLRNRVVRLRQKTALAQCTVLGMAASLETVPPLYQVNARQFLRRITVMYDKDWGYVLSSEPQTLRQCLNFYRCHSTSTNQQAETK